MTDASTLRDTVLRALARIVDPAQGSDIVSSGMVQGLVVSGTFVRFVIEVSSERGAATEPLRKAAELAALAVPGIESASVVLTAHHDTLGSAPSSSPVEARDPPPDLRTHDKRTSPPRNNPAPIEGIGRILAVGSGKGGVGKSTIATHLALALTQAGRRVGLLDADVYGPSQPCMLGVSGRPSTPDGKTILPLQGHGITVMSMGFLLEASQSVIWRGPMLISALKQMLHQVRWGALDDLIVDLPPGTGDVQLSLCQSVLVDGAVIVSTPQDVALLDARKAIDMFRKLDTKIVGIIENMSGYVCPHCGQEAEIFGRGGAEREAESLGVPFLGAIPIDIGIRKASDYGTPLLVTLPNSPQSLRFHEIAQRLIGNS